MLLVPGEAADLDGLDRGHMTEKREDTLRITNQFRKKGGMVYDLRGDGTRLTLVVSPRTSSDDLGDWHIEARVGGQTDGVSVQRWAKTRVEALQAVGVAWGHAALPAFDWDAVRVALAAVRAV